ncbi:hypothetical protein GCM10011348_04230 [Marinobacterium nitratireducens]|uniref:Transmembrane anchor protein n=1 Tax=Marinobacterium nitratireducens TaxID=518897 RepID=A0A917Z6Q3_9GAMM|nr:hypothetical protein [Marinobacterium nitratireducens]GGO76612.1 hypothetical protein GCM10011348_04230 [Marinobacterium nitratireducens]
MRDISDLSRDGLPSGKSLVKATALAAVTAGALLVTAILPAEYGIDPTGLGESMGLMVLGAANAAEPEGSTEAASVDLLGAAIGPVWKSETGYRSDEMSLTLMPRQGAEIKAVMQAGENFVFHWEVEGGAVSFDMHGEPPNGGDEFTSFWLGRNETTASGSFEAPFEGTHGWYWQNNGSEPVTVHLTTAGYYAELYQP